MIAMSLRVTEEFGVCKSRLTGSRLRLVSTCLFERIVLGSATSREERDINYRTAARARLSDGILVERTSLISESEKAAARIGIG